MNVHAESNMSVNTQENCIFWHRIGMKIWLLVALVWYRLLEELDNDE